MAADKDLDALRTGIKERLGNYRAEHVLSTEEEAVRIAQVYLPECIRQVRISALLHDITKEYDTAKQLQILSDFGIIVNDVVAMSPKVLHAMTAALIVPIEFPEFSSSQVVSAIRNHTCGHKDMSLLDIIIYLADYIEPLRKFNDCKRLREYFWGGLNPLQTDKEKLLHLYRTMVLSFDMTIANLVSEGAVIMPDSFEARNAFVLKCMSITEDMIK